MLRWSIQLHKWIALIVGIQVLGWVLGGLIMTALPIEKVRGEHHDGGERCRVPDPNRFRCMAAYVLPPGRWIDGRANSF